MTDQSILASSSSSSVIDETHPRAAGSKQCPHSPANPSSMIWLFAGFSSVTVANRETAVLFSTFIRWHITDINQRIGAWKALKLLVLISIETHSVTHTLLVCWKTTYPLVWQHLTVEAVLKLLIMLNISLLLDALENDMQSCGQIVASC